MNHIGVAMGRKRLVQKRLDSGVTDCAFCDMRLKCHQHYYVTTARQAVAENRGIYSLAAGTGVKIYYALSLHLPE